VRKIDATWSFVFFKRWSWVALLPPFRDITRRHGLLRNEAFSTMFTKLCVPFGVVPVALVATIAPPAVTYFLATFCAFEIGSQEFHKWAHQLPRETPKFVNWLQKMGLTVGRKPHAQHHLAPYDGNYGIVSGVCIMVLS
jgi:hypothetical protein